MGHTPKAKIDSVMIVEPLARIRAGLEVTLQQGGYRTIMSDGTGVLEMIEDEVPDVVLLSCHWERAPRDGFDLCKQIVADEIAAAVVLTSSNATKELVIRAVRAGAKNFVVTPANGPALCPKLEQAFSQTPLAESRAKFPIVRFGSRHLSNGQKVDIIMRDAATIRVLPQAVAGVLHVTSQGDTGAQDVARAVGSDPTIAAMVLKLANSAFYGAGEPVADIETAVVRMGFRECRDQVIGLATANLFPRNDKSFGFNRIWYWIHSLACGLLAEQIARRVSFDDKKNAFTTGLLHDLGKIVLDDFLVGPYGQVVRKAHTDAITMREAEQVLLERDHAQVGGAITAKWRFPECVSEAIANHHKYDKLIADASPSLAGAVSLADIMTKALLIGSAGDFIVPNTPTSAWARYNCEDLSFHALLDLLYEQLREFCEVFSISEEQVDVALDRDYDSGTAVLYDPQDKNRLLLSMFLVNQGFDVTVPDCVADIGSIEEAPQLCVIWPTDSGEALCVCEMIESHAAGPWPTICIAEHDSLADEIRNGRDWLRIVRAPLDCFTLLIEARELLPDILKATIIAHGGHRPEPVATV